MTTSLTSLDMAVITIPVVIVMVVALVMRRYLRSVADYLAASRCAGRYLICCAMWEAGSNVLVMIAALEMFSKTGFSLQFWSSFTSIIVFFFGLLGLVSYRFRETNALTFHQFFETRYSKGTRVLASFLNVFSGIFNFGIQPAIVSRFFVYFCGFPQHLSLAGLNIPTHVVIMFSLMALSLFMTLSGGQVSVMVTDALEGLISSIFYLVVGFFVLATVSTSQMQTALLSGPAGKSFVDPFEISGRPDFNAWYVIFALLLTVYTFRGNAWQQGFAAAAKSPHEGRMAQILGNWRSYSYTTMTVLTALGAFTVLNHPDFAAQRHVVEQGLHGMDNHALESSMRMPLALGALLGSGVKGAFCAIALFGVLASQGVQLHIYGSTVMQDIILPLRKKPFTPQQHVRWLKMCAAAVGLFACFFSLIYEPMDYLVMITTLIGAIYLGGIGVVVWGGLYWRRGTRQGACVALVLASSLAVGSNLVQQFWPGLSPVLMRSLGHGAAHDYVAAHAQKFPFNGQQLAMLSAAVAFVSYVVVSLCTCRKPFDLESMLHRRPGGSALASAAAGVRRRGWLQRLINIDGDFTRGDKFLAYGTLTWALLLKAVALSVLLWSLFVGHLSAHWWFGYTMITSVWLTVTIGVIVTIWFSIGIVRDLRDLFRTLASVQPDDSDDGTVHAAAAEQDLMEEEDAADEATSARV